MKDQENGGVGLLDDEATDPFPPAEDVEGDDSSDDPDAYHRRPATDEEIERARAVLAELQERCQDWTSEQTVDALVQIVDVHPTFTPPDEWQGEDDEEYREAYCVREMVTLLLRGCRTLAISPRKVTCLWRNKAKWTRGGKVVHAGSKSFDTRTQFLTGGVLASIEVNYHDFKALNPLQKVFVVYHALAELDAEGSSIPPDFSGYRHEIEVFGARVFRDMVSMAESVKKGLERAMPHQLSLLDQVWDEEASDEAA